MQRCYCKGIMKAVEWVNLWKLIHSETALASIGKMAYNNFGT